MVVKKFETSDSNIDVYIEGYVTTNDKKNDVKEHYIISRPNNLNLSLQKNKNVCALSTCIGGKFSKKNANVLVNITILNVIIKYVFTKINVKRLKILLIKAY